MSVELLKKEAKIKWSHDGAVHFIDLNKPHIRSEFWYDDEYPSPLNGDEEHDHDYFVAENLRWEFGDYGLDEWLEEGKRLKEYGVCSAKYEAEPFAVGVGNEWAKPVFSCDSDDLWRWNRHGYEILPISEDDLEGIIEAIGEWRNEFVKRLERYWKRYRHKVRAYGYWAWR